MTFDGGTVVLPAGRYSVQVKRLQYREESYERVSRARVISSFQAELGPQIAEIGVDASTLGILDAVALSDGAADEFERPTAEVESSWQSQEDAGYVQWGDADTAILVRVSTGFGDGTFPV